MDALKNSDSASVVNENPTENKKVIQKIAPPSEELVMKLNAMAKAILFRNLRKEKKNDPL
jgi:hypothetical protein